MDDDHRPETVFSASSRKTKYLTSFSVYYCNIVLGTCTTFLGPLVLEFTSRFNASVDQVSKVFTIILVCYLLSALFCTLLFKCVNRQLVVMFLLSLVAVSLFLIPEATDLTQFFVCSSLIGLGSGGYDTAQVAWIIDIWRDESPPWILGQHFAYSLGMLATPIILANFLTNSRGSYEESSVTTNAPVIQADIRIPFYIAGSMAILAVIINFVTYFALHRNRIHLVPTPNNIQEEAVETSWERESLRRSSLPTASVTTPLISHNRDAPIRKIYIIGLCCCVIGFYASVELCTQQFFPTYAHFSPLKLSPTEAAKVLFGLQLGYTLGRLCGIFLVLKIRSHFILAGNLILLLISNTILFIWGGTSITWLWVGSIMIGVGMSTVYPSLYAFIEKYLFVTESVSGVITVASGTVLSIYPLIVGNSVERNPDILIYVNYFGICMTLIAFALLFSMTYIRSRRGYTTIL